MFGRGEGSHLFNFSAVEGMHACAWQTGQVIQVHDTKRVEEDRVRVNLW